METFFIQLGRGTGIAGLTGISSKSGNIFRPLLFATRAEIDQYAKENNIPYREDSSNKSDKYLRNYLRHNIIPEFTNAFPNFKKSFSRTLDNIGEAYQLYKATVDNKIKSIVEYRGDFIYINIPKLQQLQVPKTILFEIIRQYGFSSSMINEIFQAGYTQSGKKFYSQTHILIKDRNHYIISVIKDDNEKRIYIEDDCISIIYPLKLKFEIIEHVNFERLVNSAEIAQIDFDKLVFPLILRKWQFGDYFIPLGMKGMKKLSDFFIDIKLSLAEKEATWILTSNTQIVWIAGKRIDDRFKITDNTRKIYKITSENVKM